MQNNDLAAILESKITSIAVTMLQFERTEQV